MSPRTRCTALAACGLVLLGLVGAGLACHRPGEIDLGGERLQVFVAIQAAGAMVYFAAVALARGGPLPRRALLMVLALAAALRVAPLVTPAFLSSDLYRYVWDGRVQAEGINPYRYLPAAPELAFLRDAEIFGHTNRSEEAPTIYPPAAQLIFAAIGQIWSSTMAVKLVMAGFEAVAIGCVVVMLGWAGMPRALVLIYAWNPLTVWEYAGNGHIDAASIGFLALAWLAASASRRGLAGATLAAAILCKFLPAAVFPAFWRRWDWGLLGAMLASVAGLYALYLGAGWQVLGFLPGYAHEEGLASGSGIFLLRLAGLVWALPPIATPVYLTLGGLALAGVAAGFALGPKLPAERGARVVRIGQGAAVLATAAMVVISPHYPWYLGWLALFACLAPYRAVIYLSASGGLLYLDPYHRALAYPVLVYGPCIFLAAWDVLRMPSTRQFPGEC